MEAHHFSSANFATPLTLDLLNSEQLNTIDPTNTVIKMEDLQSIHQASPAPSTAPSTTTTSTTHTSTDSKPVKKRKSWGQVLPEPKTNLPPRKRAKTEDEKEQRRIERVKRNRLAAHNSRERKRQEVELLQAEKEQLEATLKATQDQMARMAAELKAYRQRHGSSGIPETKLEATPPVEDLDSMTQSDTVCPRQTSFPSPESMDSMDTPRDTSSQPATPAFIETNASETDQTRYPAAILCDLQCQSASAAVSTSAPTTRQQQMAFQMSMAFLFLLSLQICSMRTLSTAFWTSASSLMPANPLAWWTPRKTSSTRPSSLMTRSRIPMAFATQLVLDPSICRQTQAQLSLATSLALQRRFSSKLAQQSSGQAGRSVRVRDERRRQARLRRARLLSWRKRASLKHDIKSSIAALDGVSQNHGKGNHGTGV